MPCAGCLFSAVLCSGVGQERPGSAGRSYRRGRARAAVLHLPAPPHRAATRPPAFLPAAPPGPTLLPAPAPAPAPLSVQVRKFAADQYAQNGITLHAGHVPKRVAKGADGRYAFTVAGKDGEETTLSVDLVMAATGGWVEGRRGLVWRWVWKGLQGERRGVALPACGIIHRTGGSVAGWRGCPWLCCRIRAVSGRLAVWGPGAAAVR